MSDAARAAEARDKQAIRDLAKNYLDALPDPDALVAIHIRRFAEDLCALREAGTPDNPFRVEESRRADAGTVDVRASAHRVGHLDGPANMKTAWDVPVRALQCACGHVCYQNDADPIPGCPWCHSKNCETGGESRRLRLSALGAAAWALRHRLAAMREAIGHCLVCGERVGAYCAETCPAGQLSKALDTPLATEAAPAREGTRQARSGSKKGTE